MFEHRHLQSDLKQCSASDCSILEALCGLILDKAIAWNSDSGLRVSKFEITVRMFIVAQSTIYSIEYDSLESFEAATHCSEISRGRYRSPGSLGMPISRKNFKQL